MNHASENFVKRIFSYLPVGLTRRARLQQLRDFERDVATILALPPEHLIQLISASVRSKSQLRQDLFVLSETKFKQNGFFVEFGAADGVNLSNTHLLEKDFGWHGVLAEPARCWHEALRKNRNCEIEIDCVWRESGTRIKFNEVPAGELSTISSYSDVDKFGTVRANGTTYEVQTISLVDLLQKYDAPKEIDYLSIDTEGSEFEILNAFDFDRYLIRTITCEHNFTRSREKIFNLLSSKGYLRKYQGFSNVDDWYVKAF